jgi:hypothetical protein
MNSIISDEKCCRLAFYDVLVLVNFRKDHFIFSTITGNMHVWQAHEIAR